VVGLVDKSEAIIPALEGEENQMEQTSHTHCNYTTFHLQYYEVSAYYTAIVSMLKAFKEALSGIASRSSNKSVIAWLCKFQKNDTLDRLSYTKIEFKKIVKIQIFRRDYRKYCSDKFFAGCEVSRGKIVITCYHDNRENVIMKT
jgi:hypothetical protein